MTNLSEIEDASALPSKTDGPKKRGKQGLASMTPEQRREIASKGGEAVAAHKRSFSQNKGLAAAAGRKGGISVTPEKRNFSRDKQLAQAAGRKRRKARDAKLIKGLAEVSDPPCQQDIPTQQ